MEMHQLPGQLSSEMMDSLFDLPDGRFPSVDNDLFSKPEDEISGDIQAITGPDMPDIHSIHSVHSDISPLNATASPEGDSSKRDAHRSSAAGPHPSGDDSGTSRDRYSADGGLMRRHHSLRRPSTGSRHSLDGRHDGRHDSRHSVGYGENGVDPAIFYSPALGPHNDGTPLLSPRDLPLDRQEISTDFSMPPAAYASPGSVASQGGATAGKRKLVAGGRVTKASPQIRPRPRAHAARSTTTSPKDDDEVTDLYMPPAHDASVLASGYDGRAAATPATLMNIYQQAPADVPPSEMEERLTSAILATQSTSSLSRRSSQRSSPASTPGLTPRMTPGMMPLDRRVSAASVSSQSSAVTPGLRARPGSRIGSVSLSPAIVPTATSGSPGDDMAHILATKSNIQSLLDGSHHQIGLQYPERLASELSNKKTNHKMAEQERRNRMNSALVELGRLVETEGTPSKAAMVEAAISHIVMLNQHVAALEAQVRAFGGDPAARPPK